MAVSGINDTKLKNKSQEIIKCAEEASKKLQEIELLVKDSNAFFRGDIYNAIEEKIDTMSLTFPIVKDNIISYSEDLINVINQFNVSNDTQALAIQNKKIDFDVK
jgi:hypothetical protein